MAAAYKCDKCLINFSGYAANFANMSVELSPKSFTPFRLMTESSYPELCPDCFLQTFIAYYGIQVTIIRSFSGKTNGQTYP